MPNIVLENHMDSRIHVAVGVIYNKQKNKVLISKRTNGRHLAGLWEFPGGKIHAGEKVKSALKRELNEEIGINIHDAEQLTTISHDYPDKNVLLDVWSIYSWNGEAIGKEDQEIAWVKLKDLKKYSFPKANNYIINSILLPSTYVISQNNYDNIPSLIETLRECFEAGLKIFQLRLERNGDCNFDKIIKNVKQLSDRYGVILILNGAPDDVDKCDVDGIHLNSLELYKCSKRPVSNRYILGASCHSEAELKHAASIDVDYVFISPVNKTKSHPEQSGLGWEKFEKLCRLTDIPSYALGGIRPGDIKKVKSCGGLGIAMLSAIWDSNVPGDVIQLSNF